MSGEPLGYPWFVWSDAIGWQPNIAIYAMYSQPNCIFCNEKKEDHAMKRTRRAREIKRPSTGIVIENGKHYFNGRGDLLGPMDQKETDIFLDQYERLYHRDGMQFDHVEGSTGNIVREAVEESLPVDALARDHQRGSQDDLIASLDRLREKATGGSDWAINNFRTALAKAYPQLKREREEMREENKTLRRMVENQAKQMQPMREALDDEAQTDMARVYKGATVSPSEEYHQQFPKSRARSGVVVRKAQAISCWVVKWSEEAQPQTLHNKYFTVTADLPLPIEAPKPAAHGE